MDIRFPTASQILQTPGHIKVANMGTQNLTVEELCYQLPLEP